MPSDYYHVSENDHTCPSHPVIFDALNGAIIKDIASHMKGSAGPSGLDAEDWRHICAAPSKMFQITSAIL